MLNNAVKLNLGLQCFIKSRTCRQVI